MQRLGVIGGTHKAKYFGWVRPVCQGISDAMMDVVLAARALISFAGIILVHLASSSDVSSLASRPLAVSLNAALPVSVLRGAI